MNAQFVKIDEWVLGFKHFLDEPQDRSSLVQPASLGNAALRSRFRPFRYFVLVPGAGGVVIRGSYYRNVGRLCAHNLRLKEI